MKTLQLDEETLQKGWGADGQYWFSLNDYVIKDITASAHLERPENMTEEAFLLSLGYIPYFRVKRVEMKKAFVETLSNKKLKEAMSKIEEEDFVEAFWKYYKAYPESFAQYETFQNEYLLQKAEAWCKKNGIRYTVK